MLERVRAMRFDRHTTNGKTRPCLLECVRAAGEEIEVIVKVSAGCERLVGGLVAEAIAAMLAADLGLPVPEPVIVDLDAAFIDLLPATTQALLRRSVRVAFGSTKLPPGFAVLSRDKAVPPALRQQAVDIFAFDALIQNPDRRSENPNCLLDGNSFAIFDHELAFVTEGVIGWQPPWQWGALESMRNHVFFGELSQLRSIDLSRIQGAWRAISDARLSEYQQALPSEWAQGDKVARAALLYVAQIRDNIQPAILEITRVLT